MFEALRYNLKHNRKSVMRRVSAWLIFGIIILVFGFWGINKSGQQGFSGGTAATVNGKSIPVARLQEAIERLRRDPRMQQYEALGGDFGQKLIQSQALSQVVEMELVKQKAEKEHILASDAEVRDTIVGIPAFQDKGQFKREIYNNYLTQTGKSGAEFETEIRQEQALRRTVELFRSSLAPSAIELERLKALNDVKANVEFLKIPAETLVVPESVKQADVAAFLAKPENAKKAKDYYEAHKKDYSNEEEVKARHILIKTVEGDKDSENRAFSKAQDLTKKLRATNGANFATLAKANSDDPGSKEKGGDLGYFAKGHMVEAFEKAAFDAKVGEILDPVKTQFGYHIIQVEAKKPAATRTFEQAQDDIAEAMIAKEQSVQAMAALEAALKTPAAASTVASFANEHKLKWEEAGAFSLQTDAVPKVGGGDDAVRAAFGLTPEKPIAAQLIRDGANAYVLRYKAVAPEKDKKAEPQDNPEMMAAFEANRRSEDALRGWVDAIRKHSKIVTSDASAGGVGGGGSPFDDQ